MTKWDIAAIVISLVSIGISINTIIFNYRHRP